MPILLALASELLLAQADEFRPIPLKSSLTQVQPMTGIVLWSTNERVETAPIQLEFAYFGYDQLIKGKSEYDFSALEELLQQVASRKHQAIVRFYDTYVGKPSAVPQYVQASPGYQTVEGKSEGKKTGFPDWSHQELQQCILDFFSEVAKRYDRDSRIAFLQVGFGLWAEYHIYEGPMQLGKTFPSKQYQEKFLTHLQSQFVETPWMISVDAADDERSPITTSPTLVKMKFGLFDDSFNHKQHAQENAPNWLALGADRWRQSPTGGEFSFFEKADQAKALGPRGPHGIGFEEQAAKFHLSFIIGDDQLRFQKADRVQQAGMSIGYRFRLTQFETNGQLVRGTIENVGIAPIYYDAYPVVGGTQVDQSLKGLLPGASIQFKVASQERQPSFAIACSRLVQGQQIQWETKPE